jgi:hypothetical protein
MITRGFSAMVNIAESLANFLAHLQASTVHIISEACFL